MPFLYLPWEKHFFVCSPIIIRCATALEVHLGYSKKLAPKKFQNWKKNEGSKILNFLEKFDRCMIQGPDAKKN